MGCILITNIGFVADANAQAGSGTPEQTYRDYAQTVKTAATRSEIKDYLTPELVAQLEEKGLFEESKQEEFKAMQDLYPVNIIIKDSEINETNAVLTVTGTSTGETAQGTVMLRKEAGGQWRIISEEWKESN